MFIKERTKKDFHKLCCSIGIFSLIGLGSIGLCTTQQVLATSQRTAISWDSTKPMGKYTIVQLLNALKANPDKDIEEVLQALINEVKEASQTSTDPEFKNAFRNAKDIAPDISNEKIEKLIGELYSRYVHQADEKLKNELVTTFVKYRDYIINEFKNENLSWTLNSLRKTISHLKQEQKQARREKNGDKANKIGKQITDDKNAYMMSAAWDKDITLYFRQADNIEKLEAYKSLRNNIIKSGIENAIHQVRDTDNPNGLYQQVAKYVGRINCPGEGFFTGTGTLISWPDMPEALRGRVVLAAAHNYYYTAHAIDILKDRYEGPNFEEVKDEYYTFDKANQLKRLKPFAPDIKDIRIKTGQIIGTNRVRHPEQLSFSIDLSNSQDDIVACPPIKINIDNNHRTIKAKAFYTIGIVDSGDIPDVAVCILEKPAIVDGEGGCNIDYIEDDLEEDGHNKDLQAFAIGYGRPHSISGSDSYFEKYIVGQYVKKSTPYSTFNKGFMYPKHENLLVGAARIMTGPSDSGGPIIYKKGNDYKIFSVVSGVFECLINNVVVDWIKAVANYHAGLEASSPKSSDQLEDVSENPSSTDTKSE